MNELSKEQSKALLNLLTHEEMEKIGVKFFSGFEMGGHYFLGNYNQWAERFIINNADGGDFFVWLQNNCPTIK